MERNAVLLYQQNFLFSGHSYNDGCTGPMDPINVFPMTIFDQRQEFAGVQNYLAGLIHLLFNNHSKAVDAESKFIASSPRFLAT